MNESKNKVSIAGGKARWAKIAKSERSKIMKRVRNGEKFINKKSK